MLIRSLPVIIVLAFAFDVPSYAEGRPAFLGQWVLNAELSEAEQPKKKSRSGGSGFRPNVSVGGIFLPVPGSGGESGGAPIKTPDAVYAKSITVYQEDDGIVVDYNKLGQDKYVAGNVQGTKTRWSDRKLTSSFKTTSASVREQFEVKDDGRLYITIKVNPKSGSTRTFKRVFDRVTPTASRPPVLSEEELL